MKLKRAICPEHDRWNVFAPQTKLLAATAMIAATFSAQRGGMLLLLGGAAALTMRLTGASFCRALRHLAMLSWLLLMTGGIRLYGTLSSGSFDGIIRPADAAWRLGLNDALIGMAQIGLLVVWVETLNAAAPPLEMVAGLTHLLRPLNRLGAPVSSIAMTAMLACRFLPMLAQEADALMQARIARGLEWSPNSWRVRVKQVALLCVPLFNSLLRRVEWLTLAMENRAFTLHAAQTSLHACRMAAQDYGLVGASCGLLCWCVLAG